jgi:succinate dehydrogenase / fumarate reductase cytochrome b subunit
MASTPQAKPARPLSPHLQVYRPQLTSVMSVFHRGTGIWLSCGLPIFVVWLVALATNEHLYNSFVGLFQNWFGQLLLFGWSWAFFYHLCTGIRHLLWDAGWFLDIKGVYTTGWIALAVSTFLTAYVWLRLFGYIA